MTQLLTMMSVELSIMVLYFSGGGGHEAEYYLCSETIKFSNITKTPTDDHPSICYATSIRIWVFDSSKTNIQIHNKSHLNKNETTKALMIQVVQR